jgi:hypothetical protein
MFGEILGSVVGGLLGGGGSESSQTSNQIDPRLAKYVYGENDKGGLLGDVMGLYRTQMGQGGLNDLQRGGMEMQRQYLMSPNYTQGYNAMQSMGLGLMGGGVASNPFTSGSSTTQGGMGGGLQQRPMSQAVRPTTNLQFTPMQYQQNPAMQALNTPIPSAAQYQATNTPTPPAQDAIDKAIEDYMKANGLGKYAPQQQDFA